MKKLFRRFCTLMIGTLFCTAVFGSLGMSNGAQIVGVKELEAVSLESSSEIVMPTSICTPTKPELTKKYNSVATQYTYYETFSVRTGPNKVSIKASVDIECDMYSSVFGFYLDPV